MTTLEFARASLLERAPVRKPNVLRIAGSIVVLALIIFSIYSLIALEFSWNAIVTSSQRAVEVFSQMDPISLPGPADLAYLIAVTLGITVLGTMLAAVLSVPVAWISASNTTPAAWLQWVGRTIGVVTRAIPDVVIALALSLAFVIGSPTPGIIAFGIHSIGMISKLFADAIEQIDDGPRKAMRAAGATRAQEFWSGVFPQVLPSWIATVLHRFDINLRASAILGYAGVGGLGYAMKVAFGQFPQGYGRGLGIALVIFALCVVMEVVSSTIRRNLLGVQPAGKGLGDRIVRAATRGRAVPQPAVSRPVVDPQRMMRRPWTKTRVRDTVWVIIALAVIVASVPMSQVSWTDVSWEQFGPTLASFWPPNLGSYAMSDFLEALLVTVQVAFTAALLSLVFSLIFGSFAARNVAPNGPIRNTFRVVLVIIRGVPELVLAIFLIMITGLGNQAGTIALAVGGVGLLGKLVADSLEEVPSGPERALTAAGATRGQRYVAATVPQAMPAIISNSLYLVDTNIRAATILGIVGGSGIGFYLTNASPMLSTHGQVTTLVVMIVVTVLLVEGIATFLRKAFK